MQRGRSLIHIENRIHIGAPASRVLELSERVVDWPRILAHYRKVEVPATRPEGRIEEMSAFRAGVLCNSFGFGGINVGLVLGQALT